MTEKGESTYRENCAKHKRKIEKTWKVLEDIILALSLPDKEHNIDSLRNKECEFQETSDNYIEKTQIFIDFLKRTKRKESESELTFTKNEYERTKTIMDRVQRDIKTRKLDFVDTVSQNSSQHSSQTSSVKKRI
ncbi:hypothetical protein SNE40_019807 [Patella caerulea]|uniref:Uncharacterized protein n=1 Tax=Patella caerulea TaxID=87958 RepID=A0AAN8G9U8_PATCE